MIQMEMEHENVNTARRRRFNCNAKEFALRRLPVLEWAPKYTVSKLLQDILAGITVGLTEIPQGIAYAVVAGLDPQYGLYSGFMGCFMYAIFGSCKDVNIGPTAIMAAMVQPHVSKLGPDICVLLTFFSGIIIFTLGVLHLGFLIEFISYPVTAGFTTAAALQIASTQINGLMGIPGKSNDFLGAIEIFIKNVSQTSLWDSVLGISSMIVLILMREMKRFGSARNNPEWSTSRNVIAKIIWLLSLARNALIVVFGTALAYILYINHMNPFKLTNNVGKGFPGFDLPNFSTDFNGTHYAFADMTGNLGTTIAFAPLVAILECVAIAKAFSKGKVLDATQEMLALGMSNIMGSFVKSMPVTGSFTRTAVNNASGVQTQFGGVITGLLVLASLGLLTDVFFFIPKATLAAVVISSMIYLLEWHALIVTWKSRKLDVIPFVVTLLTALFWSLEYGIVVGVAVNVVFVLYTNARPDIHITKEKLPQGTTYLVTPTKELHYPAADYLRGKVMAECCEDNAPVVLDGKYIKSLDTTVAKNIIELMDDLKMRNQSMILTNFSPSTKSLFTNIDKRLVSQFREGSLESIIDDPRINRSSPDVVYSIQ